MAKSSTLDFGNILLNVNQTSKLTGLNKELSNLQKINNDLSINHNELIAIQKELVHLQEQNIQLQQQQLLQQQIQSKIQLENTKNNQKQKELKQAIFSVNNSIEEALDKDDNLIRLIHLESIKNELIINNINPDEFDEIQDKEYSKKVIDILNKTLEGNYAKLTNQQKEEIKLIVETLRISNDLQKQKKLSRNDNIADKKRIELELIQFNFLKKLKFYRITKYAFFVCIWIFIVSIIIDNVAVFTETVVLFFIMMILLIYLSYFLER